MPLFVAFAWLDGSRLQVYNARHDTDIRDYYSNYQPGALRVETPGQGVWTTRRPHLEEHHE